MKEWRICLLVLLLAMILVMTPAAAGIHSPPKFTSPTVSSHRTLLSGIDANDPATMESLILRIREMDLSPPPPQPQLSLPKYLGSNINSINIFTNMCSGCGCCS